MLLEILLDDNEDISFVSQDETSLVLDINGHRVVIISELDTFQNPILSVKVF